MHLKLDTGMGRYGLSELPQPPAEVVGLMTHLATADTDVTFARTQIERFRAATDSHSHLTRHVANSAAALSCPSRGRPAALPGSRCTGCLRSARMRLWTDSSPRCVVQPLPAQVKHLEPGQSTGYGRRFVAEGPTWIGIVPVGYGTASAATHRDDRARRGGAAQGARARSRWTRSRSNSTASFHSARRCLSSATGSRSRTTPRVGGTINYELASGTSDPPVAHDTGGRS